MIKRRFEARKQEILGETEIKSEAANGMLRRLEQFAEPFVASLGRREAKQNTRVYLSGLLSDLGRKNVESIAYRLGRLGKVDNGQVGIYISWRIVSSVLKPKRACRIMKYVFGLVGIIIKRFLL